MKIEQLPLIRDYVFVQGSTWKRRFVYKPGGVPFIFTGWTAQLQIRDPRTGNLISSITSDSNDGITLGATNGVIDLVFSETKTRLINRSGVYALELHGPTEVIPFLRGRARHFTEITV